MPESDAVIEIDKMSVDQFAGAVVLILGAIGSLLLVIWQSKCHCKVNLCYLFQCERRPPNEDEMKSLKDQSKKLKEKKNELNKPEVSYTEKQQEDEISLEEVVVTPRLIPKTDSRLDLEPEPQLEASLSKP